MFYRGASAAGSMDGSQLGLLAAGADDSAYTAVQGGANKKLAKRAAAKNAREQPANLLGANTEQSKPKTPLNPGLENKEVLIRDLKQKLQSLSSQIKEQ